MNGHHQYALKVSSQLRSKNGSPPPPPPLSAKMKGGILSNQKRRMKVKHGSLNSRRAASSPVRLVEGEERRVVPDPYPQGVISQN
ncbi:hypothetical protein TNCV_3978231 [Trichonephila clavipes]|nr:hypothetical protein TNCV_3978231 [Trichonephila clavipes]